jgi:hypothetical protein
VVGSKVMPEKSLGHRPIANGVAAGDRLGVGLRRAHEEAVVVDEKLEAGA